MELSSKEKEIIRNHGHFLKEKGYETSEGEYGFEYTSQDIRIYVGGEPYSDDVDIDIIFADRFFCCVGWSAVVRKGMAFKTGDREESLKKLLDYLNSDYELLTNEQYCKKTSTLVEEYLKGQGKEIPY